MSIRVQIVRTPSVTSIDGVQIDGFEIGRVYELGTSIATVMLAEGWAAPIPLEETAPPMPFSEADPCNKPAYRDADAPPNLTREHYPPHLDRTVAAERRLFYRTRARKR